MSKQEMSRQWNYFETLNANSVEIVRNAKGSYQFSVKKYGNDLIKLASEVLKTVRKLKVELKRLEKEDENLEGENPS